MRRRGNKDDPKPKHSRKAGSPPEMPPRVLSPLPKPIDVNAEMAKRHEAFLARLFKGRRMKGSGNQQSGQMDGRVAEVVGDPRRPRFSFAWDGKSTLGASVMVSKRMWDKACEQSHFERPMLALRYYANFRMQDAEALDLAVISAHDLAELLDRLEELERYWDESHIRGTSSVTTVKPAQATEPSLSPPVEPSHQ